MSKQLHRVQQAAEQWNVSVKTAWNWIAQGRVGVVRLGRAVRIPQEEIDRLIEEGFTPARRNAA
jgi:excisionase family DNA binding protein